LAPVAGGRAYAYGTACLAVFFFGMLYRDEFWLNRFEDRLQAVVGQLPSNQRVVTAIGDSTMHINSFAHMIDRVCIERCFSYANYEAGTAQFRVRATRPNPIVAATYLDSWRMQTGIYVVQERDLPLYVIRLNDEEKMEVRLLRAGERIGMQDRKTLPGMTM